MNKSNMKYETHPEQDLSGGLSDHNEYIDVIIHEVVKVTVEWKDCAWPEKNRWRWIFQLIDGFFLSDVMIYL